MPKTTQFSLFVIVSKKQFISNKFVKIIQLVALSLIARIVVTNMYNKCL
jgi:hypothetical protein